MEFNALPALRNFLRNFLRNKQALIAEKTAYVKANTVVSDKEEPVQPEVRAAITELVNLRLVVLVVAERRVDVLTQNSFLSTDIA